MTMIAQIKTWRKYFCALLIPVLILLELKHGFVRGQMGANFIIEIDTPNCSVPACGGELRKIYCEGRILALSWHFYNGKQCMKSKLKHPPSMVLKNLDQLPENITKEQFEIFCNQNFEDVPYLDVIDPKDWTPKPSVFEKIKDPAYKSFSLELNNRWKRLTRKMKSEVKEESNLYPAIYVPNNFVVPGGGFNIYFYWDSFWIAKGLLSCGMKETVRDMLENFGHLIGVLGYIPNGGSIELTGRSQPPVYIQMVNDYVNYSQNFNFLPKILPKLEREIEWWENNRTVEISLNGEKHTLFQYRTESNCPRPEAYAVDMMNAKKSSFPNEFVWKSITSACESGWDFSSRWFAYDGPGAETKDQIMTIDLVPVDLNAFMCKNFKLMMTFYQRLGNQDKTEYYKKKFEALNNAVSHVLWNATDGIWYDYDLKNLRHRRNFYPSNFFPMYGECSDSSLESQIWGYIQKSNGFTYPGGVPTSLLNSEQQWDFPNAWAPLVHILIEGFRSTEDQRFHDLALNITSKWVHSNYEGFKEKNAMWEKYDVRYDDGRAGGGGEYPVQDGFGWTNGVVLDLLLKYGDVLVYEDKKGNNFAKFTPLIALVSVILVIATVGVCLLQKRKRSSIENSQLSGEEAGYALLDGSDNSDEL